MSQAGILNTSSVPPIVAINFTTDAGVATPVANNINIFGTANEIETSGAGNTVTIGLPDDVIITNDLTIGGNFDLPTTSATDGNIQWNGTTYIHTFGANSIFLGRNSGNYTYTGTGRHIGIGTNALLNLSTAIENVAIGHTALFSATTSSSNVAIGSGALQSLGGGNGDNIGIGSNAGFALISGNNNKLIGISAGSAYVAAESHNIILGDADGVAAENNTIRIGFTAGNATQQTQCFIDGISGITLAATTVQTVVIDSNGQLGAADTGQIVYTLITPSDTPTALATIPIAVNTAITINGFFVAARLDFTAAAGGNFNATARRAGGGAILVGVPFINPNDDSGGVVFDIGVAGNDLVITVTGELATGWEWRAIVGDITT